VVAVLVIAGTACTTGSRVTVPTVQPVPVYPVPGAEGRDAPVTPVAPAAPLVVPDAAPAAPPASSAGAQAQADAAGDNPTIQTASVRGAAPAAARAAAAPAPTALVSLGRIEIPSIGMTSPIYDGGTLDVIDHGPGHLPGTALPGELGNTAFAGHRVTHSHPFLDIDLVRNGDHVIFDTPRGVFTYEVTGHKIVQPDDLSILGSTPDATMTIFGCHPKHSADQRYVVFGRLLGTALPAPGAPAPPPPPPPPPPPTTVPPCFLILCKK
jgi:sortase A